MARMVADAPTTATHQQTTAIGVISDTSARAIRQLVIRLAWPSIVENMLQSIFGIVLLILVARLGAAAVAGFGAANGLTMVAMSAFFSLSLNFSWERFQLVPKPFTSSSSPCEAMYF